MNVVLITGGSGTIGRKLTDRLLASGYEVRVLSRNREAASEVKTFYWNVERRELDEAALDGVHSIIHLAGAGVADKRWTRRRKAEIIKSRVDSSQLLWSASQKKGLKLDSFISASAIGIYGDRGTAEMNEESLAGTDFLAHVVKEWEASVEPFSRISRMVRIRIGIVLSNEGGALPQMIRPVKLGVGASLGSGDQVMSWIHEDDLVSIFQFALEHPISGVYNATAPNPVTNLAFTKALGQKLGRPIFLPPVPAFVLKLALGEMAAMVLSGSRVSSKKLIDKGFNFQYSTLTEALGDLIR